MILPDLLKRAGTLGRYTASSRASRWRATARSIAYARRATPPTARRWSAARALEPLPLIGVISPDPGRVALAHGVSMMLGHELLDRIDPVAGGRFEPLADHHVCSRPASSRAWRRTPHPG